MTAASASDCDGRGESWCRLRRPGVGLAGGDWGHGCCFEGVREDAGRLGAGGESIVLLVDDSAHAAVDEEK